VLEGDLTDFTLPDVLRLLAVTSKTGRLSLADGDGQGRVDLVDGRVRDASADARRLPLARRALGAGLVDGDTLRTTLADADHLPTDLELARGLVTQAGVEAGALAQLLREQTYDATFDLLRWRRGSFRFTVDPAAGRDGTVLDLALPVDELLAETTRRLESWAALEERTGASDAVVSVRGPRGDDGEVALPPEAWALLALVDGRRTVADLVGLAGQGEQRTREVLATLLNAGVVDVGAAGGAGPVERLLRDHAALADLERTLGNVAVAADRSETAPTVAPPSAPPAEPPAAPDLEFEIASEDPPAEAAPAQPPADLAPIASVSELPAPAEAVERVEPAAARQLRTRVRTDRIRTDPAIDEDLVGRLIDGVEGL
jgi:hypothetical protein